MSLLPGWLCASCLPREHTYLSSRELKLPRGARMPAEPVVSPHPPQAEMSSWLRVVNAAIAAASSGEPEEPPAAPSGHRGMTRAMTMPPVSPAGAEGPVVLRGKDGREREREKRFSFFKKNK